MKMSYSPQVSHFLFPSLTYLYYSILICLFPHGNDQEYRSPLFLFFLSYSAYCSLFGSGTFLFKTLYFIRICQQKMHIAVTHQGTSHKIHRKSKRNDIYVILVVKGEEVSQSLFLKIMFHTGVKSVFQWSFEKKKVVIYGSCFLLL